MMKTKTASATALRIAAAGAALVATCAAAHAEDRALVIGIDKYQNIGPPLQGAVNDARLVAETAKAKWGFRDDQMRLLTD
ncbi:caspase family protein, partial [Acinetobacter baumannii]